MHNHPYEYKYICKIQLGLMSCADSAMFFYDGKQLSYWLQDRINKLSKTETCQKKLWPMHFYTMHSWLVRQSKVQQGDICGQAMDNMSQLIELLKTGILYWRP